MKKIARYRIPIARTFPATHKRAGEPTNFVEKILLAKMRQDNPHVTVSAEINGVSFTPKIHTIRHNYAFWEKRFEKINRGEAVLELYYWSGRPYNSECVTICQLGKEDGIGISYLVFDPGDWSIAHVTAQGQIDARRLFPSYYKLAVNDGLSVDDFKEWFKKADLSKPFAMIHFTRFRY